MSGRQEEFVGLYDYVWFYGVVEDRNDPLHIGRVKVRCYGWHTEDKGQIPTEALPWAQVMTPIHNAAMSGIGFSATGLLEGTLVIGFFMDGRNAQQPLIMGSVAGIPTENSGENDGGFHDPNGKYPLETGYPDTPKLAYNRHDKDPITTTKNDNRITKIPTATDDSWDEPEQRGGVESKYPYNHTWQTESGHAFEVDDTEGAERIHQYHTAGTFFEIQPDGSRITKIVGNDYEISVKDKDVYVKGACNITTDGNATLYVKGNYDVKVDGIMTIHNDVLIKGLSTAEDDHISGSNKISGKGHTHTDTPGLGAGVTTPPNT